MGRSGNLCDALVVVGCVDERASHLVDETYGAGVVTDVKFTVARVVQGPAHGGDVLDLQVRGGEAEGVALVVGHEPALHADACYTLFFHVHEDGTRAFQRDLLLPARLEGVPDEAALRQVWQATCASFSGEIYTDDPTWQLVVPAGASRASMELVFQPPRSAEDGRAGALLGASVTVGLAIAAVFGIRRMLRRGAPRA